MGALVLVMCIVLVLLLESLALPTGKTKRLNVAGWIAVVIVMVTVASGVIFMVFTNDRRHASTKWFAIWLAGAGTSFLLASFDPQLLAFLDDRGNERKGTWIPFHLTARLMVALFGLFWIALATIVITL